MAEPKLTILNRYNLTATPEDFEHAIQSLASRVERQGHPGVLSYRFFVNAADMSARAVIDYSDANAWIGHHDIAMGWDEMKLLHSVAELAEVTFLGPLTPQIEKWIASSSLTAVIRHGNEYAAGFRR